MLSESLESSYTSKY